MRGCGDLYRVISELDIPILFANYLTFFGTGPVCLSALGGCYVSTAFRLCCVKYVLGDHELRSSGACSGGAICGYLRQGMAVGAFDGVAEAAHSMDVSGGNATPWGGGPLLLGSSSSMVLRVFIVVGVTPNEWGHPVHLQSCEWCEIVRECIE